MKALLLLSLWLTFAGTMLEGLFPTMWVLIPLGVAALWKKSLKPAFWMYAAFMGVDLGVRVALFFSGVPFQRRYFYLLAAVACVLAAKGIPMAAKMIGAAPKLPSWLRDEKRRVALVCAVVFFINVPKGLNPHFNKVWMREVPEVIRRSAPAGKKPILLTTFGDPRMAYYAGAEHMRFMSIPLYSKDYLRAAETSFPGSAADHSAAALVDDDPVTILPLPAGESVLNFKLKRAYPLKRGFFFWDWTEGVPNGRCEIRGRASRAAKKPGEPDRWTLLFDGPVSKRFRIKTAQGFDEFEIRLKLTESAGAREVRLSRYGPWEIMRKGIGFNNEEWYFLDLKGGIERLAENVEKIGGERVFLFIPMSRERFLAEFQARGLPCPFVHLRSFDIRKKGPHSLWKMGKP